MATYFVMSCEGVNPATTIGDSPHLPGGPWMTGRPLQIEVPQPLIFTLNPLYPGKLKAMYKYRYPVVRDDLVQALTAAGVDNIQYFQAVLRDTVANVDHTHYKAFNIVGVVACADMEQSELMGTSDSAMVDVDFRALVIDEKKTGGMLLFRLAESVNAIVVHEKVKKQVEASGIENMVFFGPGEWTG
jgi:hypothetical protein